MLRFLVLVIALLIAGPAWAQNALTGTWKSDLGSATLTFESDGTYKLTSPGEFD